MPDGDEDLGPLGERVRRLALSPVVAQRQVFDPLTPDDYDGPSPSLQAARMATWGRAIPNRFQWAQLADLDEPDLAVWASAPAGRNLLLLGPVGVGKSHAAVAAARPAHFDRGEDVRFLPVVELLDLLRPGGPDGALYDLAAMDLLILDDLGTERPTEWTAERLYALVNRRWLEQLPTVATSNLGPDEFREAVGARVFSRLVGDGALTLRLTGRDRRMTAAAAGDPTEEGP